MAKILSQEEVDALLKSHTKPTGKGAATGGGDRGAAPSQAKKAQLQRKVTLYNFRRPDRVSREQMRSLHFMHDRFARNFSSSLSAYLRTITEVNLVSVEQLSYQEFLLSVPDPTCFNAISIKPLEGALALEVNPTLVFPIIDKMLGGPGDALKQLRTMTDIEQSIFDGVLKLALEDLPFAVDALHGHADEQGPRRRNRRTRLPRRTDRRSAASRVHFSQPRVHLERPRDRDAAHQGARVALQADQKGQLHVSAGVR